MTPIPDWQRRVHVSTELAALIAIPVLWSAANAIQEPHRTRLRVLAAGILIVDGLLLYTWLTKR